MGVFNPDTFINADYDTGSTQALLVPEGEYMFQMSTEEPAKWIRGGEYDDKKTGEHKTWTRFEPLCECLDDGMRAKMGRDKVLVPFDGGFLDLDNNGRLDMSAGKNVKLNQLRDALGQNTPGWQLAKLQGAGPFKGIVRHKAGEDGVQRHAITRVVKE